MWMKCEFCGAKINKKLGICPECGLEVVQKERSKLSVWKTVLVALACVITLGAIAGVMLYKMGFIPFEEKENNVAYKDTYTVEDKEALRKANVKVASAADRTLDNATLQFYYAMEVNDFLNNYSSYLSYFSLDYTKPLDEQYVAEGEDTTWQQMFLDSALNDWYTYAIMNMLAEEEGFTISEEMQSTLNSIPKELDELAKSNGFPTADDMIRSDFGDSYTAEAYIEYLNEYYKAIEYISYLYEKHVPESGEIEAYFAENEEALSEEGIIKGSGSYGYVRHILFQPEGGTTDEDGVTTYSDEEWEACLAAAQAVLDTFEQGDKSEASFAELANKHSSDPGSNKNGGLYAEVAQGEMVDEFDSWLFSDEHTYGDYGLIRTTYGYHIMFFMDLREIWEVQTESKMISEKIEEISAAAEEKWPFEKKYAKIVLGNLKLG